MELGMYTFAEITPDPTTGKTITAAERLRRLMEEIELADEVGLDVVGIGEHHRPDFAVSAPGVVLGAAAARTKNIRLSSAVSVISSDDPVRVFQEFATIDGISGGRAEIMAGRGSFIESFPLFGYDLRDYDTLFAEKLELLLELTRNERVTWEGTHRAPLHDQAVYPRPVQDPLPVWIAVGGTPESAVRAGRLGLPLAIAIIGGEPERFAPFVELYRENAEHVGGIARADQQLGINVHGFIGEDSQQAREDLWPQYRYMMNKIARERGFSPINRAMYDAACDLRGNLLVGTPEEAAAKILYQYDILGQSRYLVQFSTGTLPHDQVLRTIELFGREVAPLVRAGIAEREAAAAAAEA